MSIKPRAKATEETLIQSLNADGTLSTEAIKRLTQLIALIQEAELYEIGTADEKRETVVAQINRKLTRYRWSPEFETRNGDTGLKASFLYHSQSLEERHENWCVSWIVELVRQRNILRVRRCAECGRWLWAVRDHQRHCSDTCRKKHASHNPTFKEKRRLYMRKYRHGV